MLPKLPLKTAFTEADGGLWLGYAHDPIYEIKGDTDVLIDGMGINP